MVLFISFGLVSIFKNLLPLFLTFYVFFLPPLNGVFQPVPLKPVQLKQFIQMIWEPCSAEKKKKLSHTPACVCATFSLALETEKKRQALKASWPKKCYLCSVKSHQNFPHNGVINPDCWFRKFLRFVNTAIGAWVGCSIGILGINMRWLLNPHRKV